MLMEAVNRMLVAGDEEEDEEEDHEGGDHRDDIDVTDVGNEDDE